MTYRSYDEYTGDQFEPDALDVVRCLVCNAPNELDASDCQACETELHTVGWDDDDSAGEVEPV